MTITIPHRAVADAMAPAAVSPVRRNRQPGKRRYGPVLTPLTATERTVRCDAVRGPATTSPKDWATEVTLTTAPTSGASVPPEDGASDVLTTSDVLTSGVMTGERDIDLGDCCDLTTGQLRALAERAGRELESAPAEDIMAWAFARFGRKLAVTSSMADTVMVHLAERTAAGLDVIFLDTGFHFVETIGTRDAVEQTFDVNLITVRPELTVAEQDQRYGKNLFARNPDLCCRMRKVEPLGRALEPYTAWATGVRRADGPQRADTRVVDFDETRHMVKIAPLATWSDEQVTAYVDEHSLLTNPLLADGYPSIGCEPCTSRPSDDADPRSGRWAGRGKTECGIQL